MSDTKTTQPSEIVLPLTPHLAKLLSQTGTNHKGMKILAWGEAGSGKSMFLAQFPSPKVVVDCGEGGIQQYLNKEDTCFTLTNPNDLHAVLDFTMKHLSVLRSFVMDPITLGWEDWMDHFNEKFGGDIRGGQWKDVKAPWKLFHRRLMRSPLHVGYSAWVDDILYETDPNNPGKISEIRQQAKPKVEKRLPHNIDLALEFRLDRDKLGRPNGKHRISVSKCRRPRTIPTQDLHLGKKWIFDGTGGEKNIWELVVEPILSKWDEGSVEWLGFDPMEVREEQGEADEMAQDVCLGRLLRIINQQTDLTKYKLEIWPTSILPILEDLNEEHKKLVMEAHEKKKSELLESQGGVK